VKRTVRVLDWACRDLDEIRQCVAGDRPDAAKELAGRLLDAIDSLAVQPDRGAVPRDGRLRARGYRFLVVRPYLVFYRVGARAVRVYRVLHGRRQYSLLL
jgi:toxin ParE1/3/4